MGNLRIFYLFAVFWFISLNIWICLPVPIYTSIPTGLNKFTNILSFNMQLRINMFVVTGEGTFSINICTCNMRRFPFIWWMIIRILLRFWLIHRHTTNDIPIFLLHLCHMSIEPSDNTLQDNVIHIWCFVDENEHY